MVAQFIHGTRYIDELVMMRAADKGDVYYHQDANWNVIALTDQGGSVVERYLYKPYGQMTVHQLTSYGDRDLRSCPQGTRNDPHRSMGSYPLRVWIGP